MRGNDKLAVGSSTRLWGTLKPMTGAYPAANMAASLIPYKQAVAELMQRLGISALSY
ncbi:MAG: hypothetical protein L3J75_15480 [Methylococcaceae bacterium]|nr:hypothetical protein [Methylococcaceae bacterium]